MTTTEKTFNVADFGALPTNHRNTEHFQSALDAAAEAGGIVEVPAGEYVTGTLEMKSGVTLRLTKGATLKGSPDLGDYTDIGIIHNEWGSVRTLLFAIDADDIGIEGPGTIDFDGSSFFDFAVPHSRKLDTSGYTPQQMTEFDVGTEGRPNQAIFLHHCRNVTVSDVRLVDSAGWGLCISSCDTVRVKDVTIRFGRRIPNADGIHFSSCRNVIVSGCDIVSGDDCIAITGINDWTGQTANIVISNCLLSSSSAGIRLGFWHSRVKNVLIQNCVIYDSVRGITVMSCGAGLVEDIVVAGVSIETRGLAGAWWGIGEAIYVSAQDHEVHNSDEAEVSSTVEPINIRNITFRDVSATSEYGFVMIADRDNAADIRVHNARIALRNSANRSLFGDKLDLHPGSLERAVPSDATLWLYAERISDLVISDVAVRSELSGDVHRVAEQINDCANAELVNVRRPSQEGL